MSDSDIFFQVIYDCLNGDEAAYQEFYNLFCDQVYRTALLILGSRAEAEDATQMTFIKLFKCFDTYDSARSLKAWVHRITVNVCIDICRAKKRQQTLTERIRSFISPTVEFDETLSFDNELTEYVRRLPTKLRVVLVLKYLCDMTQEEIASCLNLPVGTVKSRIGQGLSQIREMYCPGGNAQLREVRS